MLALVYVDKVFREEPFCLTIASGLENLIIPGCQVLVNLKGHKASAYIGYVLEHLPSGHDRMEEGELMDVLYDGTPVLTGPLFRLATWIADYYITKPVDAINAALPAPVRTIVNDVVELTEFELASPDTRVVNTLLRRKILKALSADRKLTVRQLQKRLGRQQLYRTLWELERGGLITFSKQLVAGSRQSKTAWRLVMPLPENLDILLSKSPAKKRAVRTMADSGAPHVFAGQSGMSREILDGLVSMGIAERFGIGIDSVYSMDFNEPQKIISELTASQQTALEKLSGAYRENRFSTFLLHGVTGSGKTLVYIELLKEVLASGRTAIVLVPEIALTPQTASRFRHYFHDDIQIMHSAMSSQEKFDAWNRLRTGRARIALGVRSTIFAPLDNVGAIIVDEEHDAAYKQDRTPRYNARDTAVMRAKFENALCVLGSATPSFESYANALGGKYGLINLPERIDNAKLPSIRLVWMPENQKVTPSISGVLFDEMRKRMARNEQVILLQNRRGFAGSVLCLDCGHTPKCRFCNIPMVYHASDKSLRCHYCGHTTPFLLKCAACSSEKLFYKSSGTERIEEELKELFPGESILRMDVDTTSSKGSHVRILKDFHDGKSRILLGTQMVAKGLDFPDVTLVGVLMADIGLNIPDFRASERLFSLLMQVAGRAGRSSSPGEVYLQIYNRDNDVFKHLLHGDYGRFYHEEMLSRTELRYPPASKLVKIEFTSPSESIAEQAATAFLARLQPHLAPEQGSVLGPAPAGIARIKGRYRFHLLLKLFGFKPPAVLIRQIQQEITGAFRQGKTSVFIDVDPQNLL